MTATKNTRANALATTNLVGVNQAVVNLGTAGERSPASLFLCAAHPYGRGWQDQDRQPGSLPREAGHAIKRSASWPGAGSLMSSRNRATTGKLVAAT